jgi:hypothetical protein
MLTIPWSICIHDEHLLVVPRSQARVLWAISWFPLVGGIISTARGFHDFATLSYTGTLSSLMYWWFPVRGWRRNFDMLTVQVCLWWHLYRSLSSTMWPLYYMWMGFASAFYLMGVYVSAKGMIKCGTALHICVHICANIGNISLYLSDVKRIA